MGPHPHRSAEFLGVPVCILFNQYRLVPLRIQRCLFKLELGICDLCPTLETREGEGWERGSIGGGEKGGWGVKDFVVCLSFIFKVLSCSNKFVLLVSMIKEKNFAMTIESQVLRITKIHL